MGREGGGVVRFGGGEEVAVDEGRDGLFVHVGELCYGRGYVSWS